MWVDIYNTVQQHYKLQPQSCKRESTLLCNLKIGGIFYVYWWLLDCRVSCFSCHCLYLCHAPIVVGLGLCYWVPVISEITWISLKIEGSWTWIWPVTTEFIPTVFSGSLLSISISTNVLSDFFIFFFFLSPLHLSRLVWGDGRDEI